MNNSLARVVKWKVKVLVTQLCPTLCDPRDYSPPGSSVHGILQAKVLEWVAISSSRRSSWPRDQTCISFVSCFGRQVPHCECHLGNHSAFSGNRTMLSSWRTTLIPLSLRVFQMVLTPTGWGRTCDTDQTNQNIQSSGQSDWWKTGHMTHQCQWDPMRLVLGLLGKTHTFSFFLLELLAMKKKLA